MPKRPLSELSQVNATDWGAIGLPTLAAKSILGVDKPFEEWQTAVEEACEEIEMKDGATWPTPSEVSALLKKQGKMVKKPKKSTQQYTVYDLGLAVEQDEFKNAVARVLRVAYSQPAILAFAMEKQEGCEKQQEHGLPGVESDKWDERSGIIDGHECTGAGDDVLEAVKARDLEALNEIVGGWTTADCA